MELFCPTFYASKTENLSEIDEYLKKIQIIHINRWWYRILKWLLEKEIEQALWNKSSQNTLVTYIIKNFSESPISINSIKNSIQWILSLLPKLALT